MSIPYHSSYTGAQVDEAVSKALPTHTGTLNLGSGVSSGTVSGLGLDFTPTKAFLTIETPSGGFVMFAVVVGGSLSAAGFSFYLSGETDSINYKLHYQLVGVVA